LQRFVRVKRRVVHGDNQQLDPAIHYADLFHQFQSALSRQMDVHHHQVRFHTANGVESLLGVSGFAAHSQVFLAANNPHQRFAKNWMVLDNENPFGCPGTWFFKLLSQGFSLGIVRSREF
jgi:hypothetical protein